MLAKDVVVGTVQNVALRGPWGNRLPMLLRQTATGYIKKTQHGKWHCRNLETGITQSMRGNGGDDAIGTRPQNEQLLLRQEVDALLSKDGITEAWDDVSGKSLKPELVAEARRLDMEYFERMKVYSRVPRSHQSATRGTSWGPGGLM